MLCSECVSCLSSLILTGSAACLRRCLSAYWAYDTERMERMINDELCMDEA